LIGASYFSIFASDIYVSESRVVVRSVTENTQFDLSKVVSKYVGTPQGQSREDTFTLVNYVRSRGIVENLGGRAALSKFYSRPKIDYFSRLSGTATAEDAFYYWRRHVVAGVDGPSGVAIITTYAFSPQEAARLNSAIIESCENLLNDLSNRMRQDSLKQANREIARSVGMLAAARTELSVFRNEMAIIDPKETASDAEKLIAKLTIDKISAESQLSALLRYVNRDAPSAVQLSSRIESLQHQIELQRQRLTGANVPDSLSVKLKKYEELSLNEQYAEKMYEISYQSLQKARQDLEQRQRYLGVVANPSTPSSSEYPKPLLYSFLLFISTSVIWGVLALIAAAVIDHAQGI
jgi:capsular polysaccharide transport system permease protein